MFYLFTVKPFARSYYVNRDDSSKEELSGEDFQSISNAVCNFGICCSFETVLQSAELCKTDCI